MNKIEKYSECFYVCWQVNMLTDKSCKEEEEELISWGGLKIHMVTLTTAKHSQSKALNLSLSHRGARAHRRAHTHTERGTQNLDQLRACLTRWTNHVQDSVKTKIYLLVENKVISEGVKITVVLGLNYYQQYFDKTKNQK